MDLILGMTDGGGFMFLGGVALSVFVITIFAMLVGWKIFVKAGFKGYESLIPIHNFIVLIQIAGKPISYFFLLLIPFANIYFMIKIAHGISKSFGKGVLFTVGLIFLPIFFFPVLAFGKSEYIPAKNLEFETVDNFSFKDKENTDKLEVEVVENSLQVSNEDFVKESPTEELITPFSTTETPVAETVDTEEKPEAEEILTTDSLSEQVSTTEELVSDIESIKIMTPVVDDIIPTQVPDPEKNIPTSTESPELVATDHDIISMKIPNTPNIVPEGNMENFITTPSVTPSEPALTVPVAENIPSEDPSLPESPTQLQ